jgi:hypothetical protein
VNREGNFTFLGLAPGAYLLRIESKKLFPIERSLLVRSGEVTRLKLSPDTATLNGTVTDFLTGEPLRALVRVSRSGQKEGEAAASASQTADSEGRFVFELLEPGHYLLEIHAQDHKPERREVELTSGETTEVSITVVRGG